MIAAAVNWEIRRIGAEVEFWDHLAEVVGRAAGMGAKLVVLPELVPLELMALHAVPVEETLPTMAEYAPTYEAELHRLAVAYDVTLVGGSHLIPDGQNVCNVVSPLKATRHPKNVMTRWEADKWGCRGFDGLPECEDHRLGVAICYDSEFPEAGRTLAERGVLVMAVPAYTETVRGFQRVRWSCQARAIENQIFVIHASLVGSLGREPVISTHGSSAILAPSVVPFPENAILAETNFDEEDIAVATLDFEALHECRESDDVRNWNDRHASRWGREAS